MPGGLIGVDVFFVISGYLISSLIFDAIDHGCFGFLDFYVRRIKRIFPSLLVVLGACFVVGWFVLLPPDYARLGLSIAGSAAFVQNLVLWGETGYFDQSAELKPLLHIWSLGIEEQFYLLWPLLLVSIRRRAAYRFAGIAAVIAISFALNVYVTAKGTGDAFYLPQTRFWELAAGAAASLTGSHVLTRGSLAIRSWLSVLGFCLLALGFAFISKNVAFPGFWALTPVAGALALILAGPDALANRHVLSTRVLVAIGLISYPLYLWHWPLLSFGRIIHGGPLRPDTLAPLVLAAFVLAYLSYRFIERPIRFGRERGNAKAIGVALVMALVGGAGYGVYLGGGLANRFPPLIAGIIKKPDLQYRLLNENRKCLPFAGGKTLSVCIEDQQPSIFVIGDSHADMLRFGLDRLQSQFVFGVDYAVGCSCVPYSIEVKYGDNTCEPENVRQGFILFTLDKIRKIRPEIVLIHARWAYQRYISPMDQAIELLRSTIAKVREASPTSKIVILGPTPEWKSRPANEIYKTWLMSLEKTVVPSTLKSGFRGDIRLWDDYFHEQVPRLGASYISAYRFFCNEDSCLARVGNSASDIVASDTNHLSPAGSIFLLEKIKPELFAHFRKPPAVRASPVQ